MSVTPTPLSWPRLVALSLATGLVIASVSNGQGRKALPVVPKPPAADPGAAVKAASAEQLKLKEANVLRQAVIVLAEANHDYDGHRVRAMHALLAGIKILDGSVMKNGSPQQKQLTATQDAEVKAALDAAKKTPILHERQPASDAQLKRASALLARVRPELVQVKRKRVLAHVDSAIKEIGIALSIR